MARQLSTNLSNSEAAKFLDALLDGVPDTEYLEIRTLKPGGGGKKRFHSLSELRRQGFEVALPGHLDGEENIYYGVAPRYEPRRGESNTDRGDAVNLATTLWLDEITLPPTDLPPFSWMVETSFGKVQAGYLLQEPTADIDRVERLNQRLGAAVGGDNVWNRGRILRLPGFINLNHPGEQRAHLVDIHPDRRYTLDELDLLLPQLPPKQDDGCLGPRKRQERTGTFDPHWPCPLPAVLQDRLADFFQGLNLRRCSDGRYGGACPLPHADGAAYSCDQAFYASPVSGSWSCFCSDHLGQTSGTVRVFTPLGLVSDFTLSEIHDQIGQNHLGPGEVRHGGGASRHENDVAARVITKKPTYRRSDKPKDRGKRSSLWAEAGGLFPPPNRIRPWVTGYLLWSERDGKGIAVDLFSNTWRNPANAQFKRRKLYFNFTPRINGPQIYQRRVPIDDWEKRVHRSISRALQRATTEEQGWMWFDNALDRGYFLYLTDAPGLTGFEPVEDVKPVLIDALKSIHPPDRGDGEGRFRPYGGSPNWVGKADDSGEEDAGRWEIIAAARHRTRVCVLVFKGSTFMMGYRGWGRLNRGAGDHFVAPYFWGCSSTGISQVTLCANSDCECPDASANVGPHRLGYPESLKFPLFGFRQERGLRPGGRGGIYPQHSSAANARTLLERTLSAMK